MHASAKTVTTPASLCPEKMPYLLPLAQVVHADDVQEVEAERRRKTCHLRAAKQQRVGPGAARHLEWRGEGMGGVCSSESWAGGANVEHKHPLGGCTLPAAFLPPSNHIMATAAATQQPLLRTTW